MKATVPFARAKAIIQGWYNEYCRTYDKPIVELDIQEEDESVSRAYRVTNPRNGTSTVVFWSVVSDYHRAGTPGIPGDLVASIWDTFNDLG
jgi:hypothetical protein